MKAKARKKLIEDLNNAFEDVIKEREGSKVARYIKKINTEIIDNIETITPKGIRNKIENTPMQIGNAAQMAMIVSSIALLLDKRRVNKERKQQMAGVLGLMGLYGLSQINSKKDAVTFAKNVHNSVSAPKGNRNKKGAAYIRTFLNSNEVLYNKVVDKTRKNIEGAQKASKIPMSKKVLDEYKEKTEQGQPINKIRYSLKRKYNSNKVVMRAVETESHNQLETAKLEQGKDYGYTHKTWFTQSDHRVRDTRFHKAVHGKKVPIDSDFRAGGQRAENPGNMGLKPKDRINCRCYLIMS